MRQLTNTNWPEFAKSVAKPSDPYAYSPASLERLMQYLDPYIVDVKNVSMKFHAKNRIEIIKFATEEEAKQYGLAWENYMKAVAEIEGKGDNTSTNRFMVLVQFLKFRQAAELIRAPIMAKRMWELVFKQNKAAICAVNFKETIAKMTKILVLDYGVPRDEISLIWGGQKDPNRRGRKSKKQKAIEEMLLKRFGDEDIEFLRELGIEVNETEINVPAPDTIEEENRRLLRIGQQSKQQRQEEIDRFQTGKSLFCLFTFKSGGVGLSLHQDTEALRQRETILAPTYSAIELVQGLGRGHRITSNSDTIQTVLFYAGTIEVRVAAITSQKLKCLRKVVRQRESWEDVIIGSKDQDAPESERGGTSYDEGLENARKRKQEEEAEAKAREEALGNKDGIIEEVVDLDGDTLSDSTGDDDEDDEEGEEWKKG